MKKYTIISTYPENGSQNIGDMLITQSTKDAIRYTKGEDVQFNVIYRASNWEDVKAEVLDCDAVIFACLAIRDNMTKEQYPFLRELIRLNKPFGVIAAGTSLNMSENEVALFNGISVDTLESLRELDEKSLFFTTRGNLSQSFCAYYELKNVTFSGDIAFFDPRFFSRKFKVNNDILNIAISDPHFSEYFMKSFSYLIKSLKKLFPLAKTTVLIHGLNPQIESLCIENSIDFIKIYEDKVAGLEIYDTYDLHVGYRVHAHVSTLNRRIPSYLLEQDGRGCDYGLTLKKKISVSSFVSHNVKTSLSNLLRIYLKKPVINEKVVMLSAVDQLIALIESDLSTGFEKFINVEDEIRVFNSLCGEALNKLP